MSKTSNVSNVKKSTQFKREHKSDYGREKIEILYQDQWLVVINKPSGMLSVPYPGSKVRTAQSVLEEILRKQGEINSHHKPYVVHRLDRDTSGVMMFALTENAAQIIMNTWHTMVSERLYHAIAENPSNNYKGKILAPEGLIDNPLAQNAHNQGFVPKPDDLDKNGKPFKTVPARTHYKIIEKGATHSLFELSLDTGKKNQIRAHLSFYGYPLAGDEEHRSRTDPFYRLCLHARTLDFTHPFTHEKMHFEVPEPKEWKDYVLKGDKNPTPTMWSKQTEMKNSHSKSRGENRFGKENFTKTQLGEKRISRKEQVHMGFIKAGKNR